MNKLQKAFNNGKAFIPFITVGDPNIEISEELILALENSGADLIELGIPFSDPTAEGPTIMEASKRALDKGITTDDIFNLVARVRKKSSVALAFMTYANVIFSYGIERFAQKAASLEIDAIILPDVPYEEKDEFYIPFKKYDIDVIAMITPTSNERVNKIAKEATGFVYCVSSLGVTGTRNTISLDISGLINQVKTVNPNIPCAIGFGISNKEQAIKMAKISDGVIIGSAIVKLIEKYKMNCVPYISEFAKEIKEGIRDIK
ncbi:MAG: tryptophan synthase subunit alpha [Spirochaetaceae bacterium]|nr:tryptophan synthase subunit alpha [Spirochaetaceae bacterium]